VSDFLYEVGWNRCINVPSAAQCVLCTRLSLSSSEETVSKNASAVIALLYVVLCFTLYVRCPSLLLRLLDLEVV
jgi:hypothetical protein